MRPREEAELQLKSRTLSSRQQKLCHTCHLKAWQACLFKSSYACMQTCTRTHTWDCTPALLVHGCGWLVLAAFWRPAHARQWPPAPTRQLACQGGAYARLSLGSMLATHVHNFSMRTPLVPSAQISDTASHAQIHTGNTAQLILILHACRPVKVGVWGSVHCSNLTSCLSKISFHPPHQFRLQGHHWNQKISSYTMVCSGRERVRYLQNYTLRTLFGHTFA